MKANAVMVHLALLGLACGAAAAEIHDAAAVGNAETLAALLSKDAALAKSKDKAGNEPLHHAAMKGHTPVLLALLEAGADVNAKGFDDWTPLHFAAKSGSAEACRTLLDRGANREALNGVSRTPQQVAQGGAVRALRDYAPRVAGADELFAAIEAGDIEKVKAQIAAKPATVNSADPRGRSPLVVAVRKQSAAIAELLLKAGANVNARDAADQSALAIACETAQPELVALLLQHKTTPAREGELDLLLTYCSAPVDPERVDEFTREIVGLVPELEKATQGIDDQLQVRSLMMKMGEIFRTMTTTPDLRHRSLKVLDLLLANGANANVSGTGGMTALKLAAVHEDSSFVKLLLERGAKPDLGSSNATALGFDVIAGRPDNIRLLLEAGADPMIENQNAKSALWAACMTGDTAIVKELMGAVKDRSKIAAKTSLLFSAAMYGQHEVVRLLLDAGCSATAKGQHNVNALHYSARSNSEECTRMLIAAGADLNGRDAAGFTPLANAVESHRNEQVSLLLAQGAKIELTDSKGATPLLCAANGGFADTIEILLKAGARRDAVDNIEMNALHYASGQGKPEAVKVLLQAGLPLERRTKPAQSTPLLLAAAGLAGQRQFQAQSTNNAGGMGLAPSVRGSDAEYANVVKVLLAAGAEVNVANAKGVTPLHLACEYGQTEIARLLIAKGAKVTTRTAQDVTPLHLAANAELVTLLLENGAEMEAILSKSKYTPLLSAAFAGNAAALERLLKHGANMNAKAFGRNVTALHVAAQMNAVAVAKVLLAAGFNIEVRDAQKLTPLMVAVTEGRQEVAAFLIERGADVNTRGAGDVSVLQIAIASKRAAIAKLLMDHGAKE